ncbi:MAG: DnaJ domain-containing protein [Candidatus Woesearchaeota archaeon]|jgi:curved DNA-binding protein CbpA
MEDSFLTQGNGTASEGSDYYADLGVPRYSLHKTIQKAFRALSMQYHPDRNPGNKEAEEKWKEVSEAYETLGDDTKKWHYDSALKAGRIGYTKPAPKAEEQFPGATIYRPPERDQKREDEHTRIKRQTLEERVLRIEKDLSRNFRRSLVSYVGTGIASLGMAGCVYFSVNNYLQEKGELWLPTAAALFASLVGIKVSYLVDFARERRGLKRDLNKTMKEIEKFSKPS